MTLSERRAAVRAELLADPSRSDRSLAALVGVTRNLVARTRAGLVHDRLIAPGPILGRDGKRYRPARIRPEPTGPVVTAQRQIARLARLLRQDDFARQWAGTSETTRHCLVSCAVDLSRQAARLRQLTP